MKLYENIVIGNFLFSLGFAISAKSKSNTVLSSVSLLQQTPSDKLLADVLLELSGFVRLIEFKNKSNKSNKEMIKHELLKAAIGNDHQKRDVSRHIHWYIETDAERKTLISYISPYLDAFPSEDKRPCSFEQFIETLAEEASQGNELFTPEELRGYLRLVACCNGSGQGGSDEIRTGGLLIALSNRRGLHYVQLNDMMQLRLQDRQYVNSLENKMVIESQNEKNLKQTKQRTFERGLSKEYGLSL